MKELQRDFMDIGIWNNFLEYSKQQELDGVVICITTNGFVKGNGACVMGRGCALQLAKMYPNAPKILGSKILKHGNIVQEILTERSVTFTAFPTKYNWYESSNLILIQQSKDQLYDMYGDRRLVVMPRPGCGNGKLDWRIVKPVIIDLPDNYICCHR